MRSKLETIFLSAHIFYKILLRDTSKPEDAEAAYEFVDDDGELEYMSKVFAELMSDLGVDIE